jgi:PAS domain-containing protein
MGPSAHAAIRVGEPTGGRAGWARLTGLERAAGYPELRSAMETQKPLPLILARNLITSIGTPAFLVGPSGELLYYNEAAGALLGVSFEEHGRQDARTWTARFGPLDEDGDPIPIEEMPMTVALRDGHPAHSRFCIRSGDGEKREIEASALPIVDTESESSGALIIFWPLEGSGIPGAATASAEARPGG